MSLQIKMEKGDLQNSQLSLLDGPRLELVRHVAFSMAHCGGRGGGGDCANVVLYQSVRGSARLWFPTWTGGWKVARSLINKAKFVSRRWFCSTSWRRDQNLPELNSLETHAEGLFSAPPAPTLEVHLLPPRCRNTLVAWPKAGCVGVGKKEPKVPGSCAGRTSHNGSLESQGHGTQLH